ncbi:MAG: Do family serine endopeptidase [Spirochaetes bacterium]|nr:Do family serine endopeptidase [Spirochaetota bacterium]
MIKELIKMMKSKKFSGVILLFIAVSLIIFSQTLFSSPIRETGGSAQGTLTTSLPQISNIEENNPRRVPDTREQVFFSFSGIAQIVLPTVVHINTVEVVQQTFPGFRNPFGGFFGFRENPQQSEQTREFRRPGLGSGVIVRQDGRRVYVLTNNHVAERAQEIRVTLNDGREFDAKIIGNDSRTDLALIMFESPDKLPIAALGDSDDLEVGDLVLAIGSPFGFESTVTMGIVSALGRQGVRGITRFTDYIQTDASINPGNSGGALVNMRGEVVGINTWIASSSGGSAGVGFAIPINNSKRAINEFIATGRITYGWLGVSVGDFVGRAGEDLRRSLGIENIRGAVVFNLFRNSPAYKSGLLPGDYIIRIGNENIQNADHLTRVIGRLEPGSNHRFTIIRNREEMSLNVRIEQRAAEGEIQGSRDLWPGIVVRNITDELRREARTEAKKGVVITSVIPDSTAAVAGLRQGDVIQEINDIPITDIGSFYTTFNKPGNRKIFQIDRQGSSIMIGLVR